MQKKVREQHIEFKEEKIQELKVKWDYDMDVTPPTLSFDDTNLLSFDSFCVSVDEQEHEDSPPLEDVVLDLPLLETLLWKSCMKFEIL